MCFREVKCWTHCIGSHGFTLDEGVPPHLGAMGLEQALSLLMTNQKLLHSQGPCVEAVLQVLRTWLNMPALGLPSILGLFTH